MPGTLQNPNQVPLYRVSAGKNQNDKPAFSPRPYSFTIENVGLVTNVSKAQLLYQWILLRLFYHFPSPPAKVQTVNAAPCFKQFFGRFWQR
jgi:hypothetical protein